MNPAVDNGGHTRPEDAAQFITVSDPVQHSEGMNKYTSYRVDVRPPPPPMQANGNGIGIGNGNGPNTNDPNDQNIDGNPNINHNNMIMENNNPEDVFQNSAHTAVLRRYSDFVWLHERLSKERAGAILPPLPEKQAVSRFSSSFIEERRVQLERFLRRVAVHPELYDAGCLDTFLRADDMTFGIAKNMKKGMGGHHGDATSMMMSTNMNMSMSASAMGNGMGNGNGSPYAGSQHISMNIPTAPAPKKDGIKKWFAEAKTSISGDLVRSPDDDLFVEIDRYIDGLEKQMKNVQSQASGLVKKGKDIANGLFEFGLAFNILGQSEADDLGQALSQMGSAADELSAVSMDHAEKEMAQFEEPLRDYLKTIYAVKAALQKRNDRRLTLTTCMSEVNTKRANLAKLRATPGAEAKAYGAEMSLKRGEAAADASRDEFATVSQRVLREVDRFKREKGDEMRRVVLDYINLQIAYNQKMEQVWADLLPKLEQVQTANSHSSGSAMNENVPPPTTTTTSAASNVQNGVDGSGSGMMMPTSAPPSVPPTGPGQYMPQQQHQQPMQPQQQYMQGAPDTNVYGGGMEHHQNMLGLEGSVQYRDNSMIS
jgi:sorting nexin-1/2